MKIEDFDRIHALGFWITIDWNLCFSIDYMLDNEQINILVCSYEEWSPNIKFDDVIELSCDIFYEWYNDNKNKIDNSPLIGVKKVNNVIINGLMYFIPGVPMFYKFIINILLNNISGVY